VLIENSQNDPRWISKPHDPVHSAIAVPLYGRRELLGLITLTHELEKYFTIDHLLLLQAIASQASIAVENSRLYAEMAREQKWLNAILKNADDIILLFDDQGRLNMMNPAGEKLFANSKNSLHQPLPINSEYESLNKLLSESRTSKSQVSGDVALFDQHHYMARIAPMEDGGQVAFLHDLSRVS
jgi:PAS domain-containing protein